MKLPRVMVISRPFFNLFFITDVGGKALTDDTVNLDIRKPSERSSVTALLFIQLLEKPRR